MECKIERVWNGELDKYKDVLDKYDAKYLMDDKHNDYYAIIHLNSIQDLFVIAKAIKREIIIDSRYIKLAIYDDYME